MTDKAYERTRAVLGDEKLKKLKSSKIFIAGLGGVGGYALEALVRMGAENFVLIDSDVFEETNINRQILCLNSNIGSDKTKAAKDRVLSINPDAKVKEIKTFIDDSNIDEILSDKPNFVIDAIDSVPSKCLLLAKCKENGITVFSSMGAAKRLDPTLVQVGDISKTYGCPLAKSVRNGLKEYNITSGIDCVFSPEKNDSLSSKELGSLPMVVGTFGFTLASLLVKAL